MFLSAFRKVKGTWKSWLLWLVPFSFLVYFFFQPLFATFQIAWQSGVTQEFDLNLLQKVWRPLRFTLWQAGLSTLITFLVGMPMAFGLSRYRFKGKSVMKVYGLLNAKSAEVKLIRLKKLNKQR